VLSITANHQIIRRGHERAMDFSVDDMVKNYEGFFLQVKESI
jgi:hypothetical protein